jgi:pyrrolysine biosynthesis protein PylD
LRPADIVAIPRTLDEYDKELRSKTGCNLLEIAEDAVQANTTVRRTMRKTKAAVVPITSGGGVIRGFPEAVAAILNHIGIKAMITQGADIVGIAEAYEQGADLVLAADDRKFVVINTRTKCVVDNATATAKAYVAALGRMANGLTGKAVLVIGVGNVGSAAISSLILRRAKPLAVDVNKQKLKDLRVRFGRKVSVFNRTTDALCTTNLIVNTAPRSTIIKAAMIRGDTLISAPAIPVGLTEAALRKVGHNLIHDPLQLGVATMAVEACAN